MCKMLTDDMRSDRYLQDDGSRCPECQSNEIIAGDFLPSSSLTADREVHCQSCDSEWTEVFSVTKIDNIQVG